MPRHAWISSFETDVLATTEEGTIVGELSSPRGGDIVKAADVVGHLLIVKPIEFLPDFETSNGARDAIRIDVCDLNANDASGQWGVVYRDALWFGRVLVSGLRRQMGELVCGWMAQGVGKPGQNPPYQLTDAMTSPEAVKVAQQWLNAHPEFEATTTTVPPSNGPVNVPAPLPLPNTAAAPAPVASPAAPPAPNGTQAAPAAPLPVPGAPAAAPAANVLSALSSEQKAALAALGFPVG